MQCRYQITSKRLYLHGFSSNIFVANFVTTLNKLFEVTGENAHLFVRRALSRQYFMRTRECRSHAREKPLTACVLYSGRDRIRRRQRQKMRNKLAECDCLIFEFARDLQRKFRISQFRESLSTPFLCIDYVDDKPSCGSLNDCDQTDANVIRQLRA